ncbi:MAG: hypothetical protein Fur0037_25700 [Planctomycetota bacterium]
MIRYEVKFAAAEVDLPRVRAELRLLPCLLRELHPERVVQSIYFDTHEATAVMDNLAGCSSRRKIRFRWYGEQTGSVKGQLECKRRENGLGDKKVLSLPREIAIEGNTRTGLTRAIAAQSDPFFARMLELREPSQWISYRRDYLASADGTLRVTIDRELRAVDLRRSLLLSSSRPTPIPRILVVEVKADEQRRESIEHWLQYVDFPRGKCSKFVLASLPGEAPIASRFRTS